MELNRKRHGMALNRKRHGENCGGLEMCDREGSGVEMVPIGFRD